MILLRSINLLKKTIKDFKNDRLGNLSKIMNSSVTILLYIFAIVCVVLSYVFKEKSMSYDLNDYGSTVFLNNLSFIIIVLSSLLIFIPSYIGFFKKDKNIFKKIFCIIFLLLMFISLVPTLTIIFSDMNYIKISDKFANMILFGKAYTMEAQKYLISYICSSTISLLVTFIIIFKYERVNVITFISNIILLIPLAFLVMLFSNIITLIIGLIMGFVFTKTVGSSLIGIINGLGEDARKTNAIDMWIRKYGNWR